MKSKLRRKANIDKSNKKNMIIFAVEIILALIIVFCIIKIIIWTVNSSKEKSKNSELLNQVVTIYNKGIPITDDVDSRQIKSEFMIDFDKLNEINTDIIGWIIIDDTNISYPILHTDNNDYYLHKNYLKKYSQSGSIFLDCKNKSLNDSNIIIYGHNMTDGLMFHQLEKVLSGELGDNVKVKIYTKDNKKEYSVFSVYMISPNDFQANLKFIDAINKSNIHFEYGDVDINSVITLYTCNILTDKRIIVHAALCNTEN